MNNPTQKQITILRKHFPELKTVASFDESRSDLFAIPNWEKIGETYNIALERILAVIGDTRVFYNYRKGNIGPDFLRQSAVSREYWDKIKSIQDADIFVIPAQTGEKWKGKSVQSARQGFEKGEFGLGAFHVAAMLLANPERLSEYKDLWIDCAGDEFDDADDGERWFRAPIFRFSGGRRRFVADGVVPAYDDYGSASAFSPQSAHDNRSLETFDGSALEISLKINGVEYKGSVIKA